MRYASIIFSGLIWAGFSALLWFGDVGYAWTILIMGGALQILRILFGFLSPKENMYIALIRRYVTNKQNWLEVGYYSFLGLALFYFLYNAITNHQVISAGIYVLLAIQFKYWMYKHIMS